jgi:cytochrome c oxidase subunit II
MRDLKRLFGGLAVLLLVGAGCTSTAVLDDIDVESSSSEMIEVMIEDENIFIEEGEDPMISDEGDDNVETEVNSEFDVSTNVDSEVQVVEDVASSVVSISMVARQFDFEPSSVSVKKGDTVRLTVTSADVAHGISIPAFGVSQHLEAGKTEVIEFVADQIGTFPFTCNVFCGSGHSDMVGSINVTE